MSALASVAGGGAVREAKITHRSFANKRGMAELWPVQGSGGRWGHENHVLRITGGWDGRVVAGSRERWGHETIRITGGWDGRVVAGSRERGMGWQSCGRFKEAVSWGHETMRITGVGWQSCGRFKGAVGWGHETIF
ncbi:hypothetical protein BD779DRAFT_1471656 [Infundibulicybe gibba]|nr:hypothetical protein BD779DRAFT_1471656 [Infundibulicybe gibba]